MKKDTLEKAKFHINLSKQNRNFSKTQLNKIPEKSKIQNRLKKNLEADFDYRNI